MTITRADWRARTAPLTLRIDTAIEAEYLHDDGVLPYVLRAILASA